MKQDFEDFVFREFDSTGGKSGNVVKHGEMNFDGNCKISIEEENHNGIKIILKKDETDTIKEIKFICSCGQTKSVLLDYSE